MAMHWRLSPLRALVTSIALVVVAPPLHQVAVAQTFVQLPDLGQNIGARLTRADAQQQLGVALFGEIGTKVSFIDYGTVYQFATDVAWGRILTGRMDYWVHEFDNRAGPGGRLKTPVGIDISARKKVYAADRSGARMLIARFDASAQNLVDAASWASPHFPRPVEAAWDGQTSPLTQDYLLVLDDSLSRITYWDLNNGIPASPFWSFGSVGSGVGQFSQPSGICVGKTASAGGGTQFTTDVYVVDRGNRRIVWLTRGPGGLTWNATAALSPWDPTDCAVDHFGSIYIADQSGHRLHKFNSVLWHIASYGSYGTGSNLNTFAFPKAVSVPCGLKVVSGGASVWYCEGRVITAEMWGDSTGAVEHYLGIEASFTQPVSTPPSTGYASTSYSMTEVAYATVSVFQVGVGTVKTLMGNSLQGAGGSWAVFWSGTKNDGTRAPDGTYEFRVILASAYTGCSYPWCTRSLTVSFYFNNCVPDGPLLRAGTVRGTKPGTGFPMPAAEMEPCTGGNLVAGPTPAIGEPAAPFFSQQVSAFAKPLMRVQSAGALDVRASDAGSGTSLTTMVSKYGVRGLRFGITRELSGQPVTIRILSMSGRLVRTLVNEELTGGSYEVAWDGLDDHGRSAAPGVYLATLSVGQFRGTQRLILRQPN